LLLLTRKSIQLLLALISIFLLWACSPGEPVPTLETKEATFTSQTANNEKTELPTLTETSLALPTEILVTQETTPASLPTSTKETGNQIFADVVSMTANGSEHAYTFAVEIRSPDTGCEQYADWWEVLTEDGELIYRRILTHSHVSEQPFTRSGGPVMIGPKTVVIVRAHMHPDGYGGAAFKGSVNEHFEEIQLDPDFAPELENADPLPDGCAF
jgi:hypothetical protein